MMCPTRIRGLSEPYGSWKTICMRCRAAQSSRAESATRSRPSKRICPALGSISRKISRPVVDLPQPDSPTSPSVSPGSSAKLTPSTARITRRRRASHAPPTANCLASPCTSRSGVAITGRPGRRRSAPAPAPRAGARRAGRPRRRGRSAGRSGSRRSARRRSGGTPSMDASGCPKRLGCGKHWSRPRVYGWSGRAKRLATGAISTMRPA